MALSDQECPIRSAEVGSHGRPTGSYRDPGCWPTYLTPSYSPRRAKIGVNSQTFLCWQRRNSITCLGTCVTLWVKRRRRSLSVGCFDSSLAATAKFSRLSEEFEASHLSA